MKYSNVHIFIDESGEFEKNVNSSSRLLVGGVILLGDYSDADDDALKNIFESKLPNGAIFPENMHFFGKNALPVKDRDAYVKTIAEEVDAWSTEGGKELHGIVIRHDRDIYSKGPSFLSESQWANRYIAMLWQLFEHILYVNQFIKSKIEPDAKLHLHIAERDVVLSLNSPKAKSTKDGFENFGRRTAQNQKRQKLYVRRILDEPMLIEMFKGAVRDKWLACPQV